MPLPPPPSPPAITVPAVRREFRGVWVATVANIDWPSRPGLPVAQQKSEWIALMDRAHALNFNAIIFQVRPQCDALYSSPYEPWSEYLTGVDGKAPEPIYDPLQFAIEEAHKRGMELHAWFNPYRARSATATTPPSEKHVSRATPSLVRSYGKQLWLDPALPETREYTLKVIVDVVTRYDIDGVHIDDYFYPYAEKDGAGANIPFPDTDTYSAYQKSGGLLSKDDFRRDAVDQFVQQLYTRVHTVKPSIKVGISPFGIAKPGSPPQIKGFDQKAELYADAVKWLNNGWCDYFAPQLYWPIEQTPQSFPVLLGAWIAENTHNRALYPGLFSSKYQPEEIAFQIKTTRGFAGVAGSIHFSLKSLVTDGPDALAQVLKTGVYAEPALVPEMNWLAPFESLPPPAPILSITPEQSPLAPAILRWSLPTCESPNNAQPWQFVLQVHSRATGNGAAWQTILVPASYAPVVTLPNQADKVSLFAVDRYGRASTASVIDIP